MNRVRDDTPLSVDWQPTIPGGNTKATTQNASIGDAAERDTVDGQPPFVFTTGDDEGEEGELSS